MSGPARIDGGRRRSRRGLGPGARRRLDRLRLPLGLIDALSPFHLLLDHDRATVLRVGPALARMLQRAGRDPAPGAALGAFLRRPPPAALRADPPAEVSLELAAPSGLRLRGRMLPAGQGLVLLDLGLAGDLPALVFEHELEERDFPASAPVGELLCLAAAQRMVLRESLRLSQRLIAARAEAEHRALTDTLTGLWNRRALGELLARLAAARQREPLALMHVDLDGFKQVNDRFGHAAGDRVLVEVARILREETRAEDMVARVGGDEFVVVLRGCADPDTLERIARRLLERLREPVRLGDAICAVGASIGIAVLAEGGPVDPDRLLAAADAATYASKAGGRGRYTLVRPDHSAQAAPGPP